MEILIWLLGFAAGYLLAKPAKQIQLNINTYSLPESIGKISGIKLERGFSVNGNKITQYWNHKDVQQERILTVNTSNFTQVDFEKYWYENELNFYLKNKSICKQDKTND